MSDNDADTVATLFPKFFVASLVQFNRILETSKYLPLRPDVAAKVAVAPVLDLMHLSGYAILFAELHRDERLSETVLKAWNAYLDGEHAEPRIAFLSSAISLTESAFELAHRSLIRTRWMQAVSHRLRELPFKTVTENDVPYVAQKVMEHESDLIRILARDRLGLHYDGIDIFIHRCIRALPDQKEVDFGQHRNRLRKDLTREANRREK